MKINLRQTISHSPANDFSFCGEKQEALSIASNIYQPIIYKIRLLILPIGHKSLLFHSGKHDHPFLFHPVHLDHHRRRKAHMAHVGRFFHSRLAVQESLVVYPVAQKVIHREISHAETGQVLEEVRALARVYTVIRQPGLHNDTGG